MSVVRWEDPPPDRNRWKAAALELQQHPGKWALVVEDTTKTVARNCRMALREHGCEVTERKIDGRGIGVWARWPAGIYG